jgi:hypothetical protein
MFHEDTEIINSVYGLKIKASPKYARKLADAIEYLGNKYLLAKPIPKLKPAQRR